MNEKELQEEILEFRFSGPTSDGLIAFFVINLDGVSNG